jgi:hypothetical protein
MAVAGVALVRTDHLGLVALQLENLRAEINAGSASRAGILVDNGADHFSPPLFLPVTSAAFPLMPRSPRLCGVLKNSLSAGIDFAQIMPNPVVVNFQAISKRGVAFFPRTLDFVLFRETLSHRTGKKEGIILKESRSERLMAFVEKIPSRGAGT